jgi:hypothetical protein
MIFARVILKILQKFKSMPQLPVLKKKADPYIRWHQSALDVDRR